MARHRSPDGRSVLETLPPPVHRRRATGTGARQAVLLGASVRRGAVAVAAVTATGGFLAVSTTPGPAEPPALTAFPAGAAAALTTDTTAAATPAPRAPVTSAPAVPVPAVPPRVGSTTPSPVVTAEDRAQERSAEEQLRRATEKRAQAARAAEKVAAEKKAAEEKAAAQRCDADTSGLGAVKAPVRTAAQFLGCRFHETEMYGVAGRGGPSDHPRGLAVDFMTDRVTGDALAACVLRNQEELGVSYVIWEQRINTGSGWEEMEDRGGVTANHFDHVHVSFTGDKGAAAPRC